MQAIIQLKADCYLYSTLDDATVAQAKFTPLPDLERSLGGLIERYGPAVAVLPYGPLTIPYVR